VEGAVVSIEPYTGYIRALVGGYDFVEGGFNHAMDARRQPGSSFKPFVYGAALENGFTPASILMDLPIIHEKSEYDKKGWKPENYDDRFLGPMRLRTALALSRNAVTVALLEKIGLDKTIDFARKAGIRSQISHDYTTALGSSAVTPLELTSAYATFASQGVRSEPILITSIADSRGQVLESYEPQPVEALNPTTAYLVDSLLKSVVEEGTGRAARVLGKPVAGKTGTTNKYVDAWFVGFTPSIVTGVWVGYDNPRASLGNKETGARAALPIWISVMSNALADKPAEDFIPPDDDVVTVKIDPETGLLARDGQENAVTDVFRRGTEPIQYADKERRSTGQLYNIDQGDAGETPKKYDPEEITD
jgi:penicillin-binding protein 1A